ncbi:glycosyltransferase [Paeniglutamicibacter terrestris]|uniref:Glycosyltransferase n=1 Tax=Paeniglutamicibacter terrestris TaxID=2723403 RepID=A0ABX1G9K4_9MICC|nr:glycosyltransferase [Paeniglutamicibacter terrestris]NKG22729.1 glycosyltransferase [Paeniglutamicibacter terrestris]
MSSLQQISELVLANKRILCVVDEESTNVATYRQWVASQIAQFSMRGAEITLLHPCGSLADLPAEYGRLDSDFITILPIVADNAKERGRALALLAINYGVAEEFDVVIGFGWTVSRGIAGGKRLSNKFWAVVDDFTIDFDRSAWTNTSLVESLFGGARKVFVFSEEKRSLLEATTPQANGRTYLPLMCDPIDLTRLSGFPFDHSSELAVFLPGMIDPREYVGDLELISEAAKSTESHFAMFFDGSAELWSSLQTARETAVLSAIPGLQFRDSGAQDRYHGNALGLIPDHGVEPWVVEFLVSDFTARGIVPISVARFMQILERTESVAIDPICELDALGFSVDLIEAANNKNNVRLLDAFGSQSRARGAQRPTRVVLAGADFKFAGDLVELLNDSSSIDLRIDLWENNSHPNPEQSRPFRDWAEVVICEFSSFNAIWYSRNKIPGQRLIVRLHGYELLQPWFDQLDFQQVDKVVFVSEFYRQKAIESKGWKESKTSVISNTIDFADLVRPKLPGSEFHLGMAGLVPILKRPDRALDLLEMLIKEDDRFVLHLRGHSPWDYAWEWKKQAHQAAYRDFYSRIGESEVLRSHIAFEGFGPDMAGWFRKIGWMLSPSYRETFHLAPVEGMASGTMPIVWNREGASDIFPKDHVFGATHDAANFILETVRHRQGLLERSQRVQQFSAKYSRSTVNSAWLQLVLEESVELGSALSERGWSASDLESLIETHAQTGTAATLVSSVREAWLQNEYSTAISLLDENIKITANDSGELKQWEHWVRGVYQASLGLETVIPARSAGSVYQPSVGRVARVVGHYSGVMLDKPILTGPGVEEFTFGVSLPSPGADTCRGGDVSSVTETFVRDIRFDGSLRMNYFVSQVASELGSEFRNLGVSLAISTGGLVESLATLLAARRIGIPFVWQPATDSGSLRFMSRFNEIVNDDPVHAIYQSVLRNSDGIISQEEFDGIEFALSAGMSIIDEISLSRIHDLHASFEKKSNKNTPLLRIVYVGDEPLADSLRSVGDVVLSTPSGLGECLEAVPDALIFGFGKSVEDLASTKHTSSSELMNAKNLKLAKDAIARARGMGIRTIFVSSSDPSTLAVGKELARKCDVVASNDRKSLVSYMRLNPNSNQVTVNVSGTKVWPVVPSILVPSTPDVSVCYDSAIEGNDRASALLEGQPYLAAWPLDNRWNDTKQPRAEYDVVKYEQHGTSENKIRALWTNCFELAQGRTAHDFATYLMRSAGLVATHKKSVPMNDVIAASQSSDRILTLGRTVVRTDVNLSLDAVLLRDLISLIRVSNSSSVDVLTSASGNQKLSVHDDENGMYTLDRVPSSQGPATLEPRSLREFETKGISIVLATYMGASRLPVLLESLALQTLPKSLIQLIVIPNGPEDGTVSVVETWAATHGLRDLVVAPQSLAGVANARNAGISLATREFTTFVDDDDFLESNFLLALYARSSDLTVVLGRLSDVDESTREVNRMTPTSSRVKELNGRVLPLFQRAGALGMNGAKLLPTVLLRECSYDPSLRSGEDVAFMAQLLRLDGVFVTSAAEIEDSSYMRVLRSNSISRRDEDFKFMVEERLEVLRSLAETRNQSTSKAGRGAIDYLMTGQLGFIKRFVEEIVDQDELQRVLNTFRNYSLIDSTVLKPLVAQLKRGIERPETMTVGRRVRIHRMEP